MTPDRTRTVPDRPSLETLIDEFVRDGYTVVEGGHSRALLRRRDHGSLLAHLALFFVAGFWTLGLANLFYAWHRRRQADVVEVVVE